MAQDSAPIPLADDSFTCAVCSKRFVPRGGEMTCPACADRVRTRTTAVSVGKHGQASLMDSSPLNAAAVVTHALIVAGAAVLAFLIVIAHWWSGALDDWASVIAWASFAATGILLASPLMSPPRNEARAPRFVALIAAVGAIVTGAALALDAALSPSLAGRATLVALAILGGLAFTIAGSMRLTEVAAWTGHDPSEAGLIANAGPFFLAVFIVGMWSLLTWFFLRHLEFSDSLAAGVAAWLIWRSLAIAWHGYEAGALRVAADARANRQLLGRTHCVACGYDMTGRRTAERCPECGRARR